MHDLSTPFPKFEDDTTKPRHMDLSRIHADDKRVRASGGETSALAPSSESRIIAHQVGAFFDKKNAELLAGKLGERSSSPIYTRRM